MVVVVVEGGVLTPASALGSSAAPAGLSWLNCAPLLYCGHDLPAAAPSAPTKSRHHTNRLVCLSPPHRKGGGEKGGSYDSCFGLSTFYLDAVKRAPQPRRWREGQKLPAGHAPSLLHHHDHPPLPSPGRTRSHLHLQAQSP